MKDKNQFFITNCKPNTIKYCQNANQKGNIIVKNNANCSGSVSCVGSTGATGITGATGVDGLSAYQVAVANGFIGTQEEWLASLIGPTGPQSVTGAIIPYSAMELELEYNRTESDLNYGVGLLNFGNAWQNTYISGFPTIIGYSYEGDYVPAFTVSNNSTITAISAEFLGEIGGVTSVSSVHVAVYVSAPMLNYFEYVPISDLTLSPSFNIETENFIASGHQNFEYPVVAGSKILFLVYITANNTTINAETSANGRLYGGISIREEV